MEKGKLTVGRVVEGTVLVKVYEKVLHISWAGLVSWWPPAGTEISHIIMKAGLQKSCKYLSPAIEDGRQRRLWGLLQTLEGLARQTVLQMNLAIYYSALVKGDTQNLTVESSLS